MAGRPTRSPSSQASSEPQARGPRARGPQPASRYLSSALESLGVPSRRMGSRLQDAWRTLCEPGWEGRTRPRAHRGGVLEIEVDAAPLREELAQFHGDRLLAGLRTALPDVALVALRFVMADGPRDAGEESR